MSRLVPPSGFDLIKLLDRSFGISPGRREGSHVQLKGIRQGQLVQATIPLHNQLSIGTFLKILRDCRITRDEFLVAHRGRKR